VETPQGHFISTGRTERISILLPFLAFGFISLPLVKLGGLALAVEWEMLEKNVLRGFKLFHVDNRVENYLDEAEVERLKDVLLSDENRMVALAILFLLVTGARLNSALHAKWRDIDLQSGVWLVPASEAKSKRANPQYLNPSALWILQEIGTRGEYEHVFVNRQTGRPFTTITRVWYRLRKQAGLNPRTRLHDLRHTFGRMVLAAGHSITELQRAMNHADCRTTMRYGHLTGTTMRTVALAASVIIKPGQAHAA
jgi:integrase